MGGSLLVLLTQKYTSHARLHAKVIYKVPWCDAGRPFLNKFQNSSSFSMKSSAPCCCCCCC
jgi:hypothetical protein